MRSLRIATWTSGEPVSALPWAYDLISSALRAAVIDIGLSIELKVEDAHRLDSGAVRTDQRYQLAFQFRSYQSAGGRCVPGQEHRLALAQLVRLGLRQGQRRDVVQRGRDGGQGPEKRRNMPEGLQFGKRNGPRLPEGTRGPSPEGQQVAHGAQSLRQIAPERADIGALAAANHEIC